MGTATAGGCLPDDTLLELVQQQLSGEAAAAAERHLDQCAVCRRMVAEAARSLFAEDNLGPARESETHPELAWTSPVWSRPPLASSQEQTWPTSPDPALTEHTALAPGAQLGRFVIEDVLGAGGMGVVYTARDPRLNRRVALKLLHSNGSDGDKATSSQMRLLREAQAMAQLAHPNVVTVYDVEVLGGEVFVAMELVPGETLKRWLARERRSWRAILDVFLEAGRGLAAAHAVGLVHRDFKPDNVLVGDDGRVRVTDFGLARVAAGSALRRPPSVSGDLSLSDARATLTATGHLVGTPAYMAPEQFLLERVDARTDQFSFCVALYEAVFGERPFDAESVEDLSDAVIRGKLREPPAAKDVPGSVREVVLRGLSPERDQRFPSMNDLIAALAASAAPSPVRTSRGRRLVVAALVAALLVGAVVVGARILRSDQPGRAAAVAADAAVTEPPVPSAPEATDVVVSAPAVLDAAPRPSRRRVKRPAAAKPRPAEKPPAQPAGDYTLIEDPWRKEP